MLFSFASGCQHSCLVADENSSSWGFLILKWLLIPTISLVLATPTLAQDSSSVPKDPDTTKKGIRFVMKNRPSLRFGKVLRVDFRAKFQGDFRGFSPERETDEGVFDLHRKRLGIQGTFLNDIEYEIERELRDLDPWRDVYANFRYLRDFQIRVGKFKLPFGLDQLTGPTNLDFVHRSLIGDNLSPGRDIGITAHGRLFKRGLQYEAGLFQRDGENARSKDNPGSERTFAGRVTGTPLRLLQLPPVFKTVEMGAAFTASTVPEGLKALRGRTVSREIFFPEMFVHGTRLRLGIDLDWRPGPFSIKGEFIHVEDERRGQSLRGQDLPDLISRGWYLSGTWVVTGEKKIEGVEPRRDFLRGGAGAIELAGRFEQLRFGSREHPGLPFRNPRSANVLGNSDRVWTFGVNWYLNRFVKIQANAIREKIEDTQRSPIPGRERFWIRICRLQFVL